MSVIINGDTGITTPAETVQGALTTTGNTILGDASTDTLNVGNGGLVKDASGNVGIGTASPASRLDVKSTAAGTADIRLSFSASDYMGLSSESDGYQLAAVGGTNALRFATGGTERMRIDSAGLLKFNSGYGSAATAYGCRAWVNFNGTGTVAIRASGNVSSITDLGTGNYRVVFTTAMVDASYSITFGSSSEVNYGGVISIDTTTLYNSSGANIYTMTNNASTPADFISNSVVFFR